MKVRFGDRYIERPFTEMAVEALAAPFFWFLFKRATRCGWGG